MVLIAYFLLIMIPEQEWPNLYGPFTREECREVFEFINQHQYVSSGCVILPLPQPDAVMVTVPFIP